MALETYGKPRATFKSPFRRGTRSTDPAVNEANSKVTSTEDKMRSLSGKGPSGLSKKISPDKLDGQGTDNKDDPQTDDTINKEAQGKESDGENEYDMQVNDIMGHIKESHPSVGKKLHDALTKHLSGSADESNNDYSQRSDGSGE